MCLKLKYDSEEFHLLKLKCYKFNPLAMDWFASYLKEIEIRVCIFDKLRQRTQRIRSKLDKTKSCLHWNHTQHASLFHVSYSSQAYNPSDLCQKPRNHPRSNTKTKPVKVQYRFLCTTQLSPAEEACVVTTQRTWRRHILRLFKFRQ